VKTALTLQCLILLSACSTQPKPIDKTVVVESVLVHQQVPDWLLKAIDKPKLLGNKYKDLVEFAIRYESALGQCNIQLNDIRLLSDENKPVNR